MKATRLIAMSDLDAEDLALVLDTAEVMDEISARRRRQRRRPQTVDHEHDPDGSPEDLERLLARADPGEVYVSEAKHGFARAISGGKGVLVLGADIARAETATARFALGRAVAT